MKKRILTMLLALAMILSVVPMMAMAVDCTNAAGHKFADYGSCEYCSAPNCAAGFYCDYGWGTGTANDSRCDACNLYICDLGGHDFIDGFCQYCSEPDPDAVCAHNWWTVDLKDGTHQQVCLACGDPHPTNGAVKAHTFENGVCIGCSAAQACSHNWYTIDLQDGTHRQQCTLCGEPHPEYGKVEAHVFENGFCTGCSAAQACDHTWWTFDLGNGTHQQKCSKCGEPHPEYGKVENHEYENGVCIDCSAEKGGNVRPPYHRPNDGKHDHVPGTGDFLAMIVGFIQNLF